MYIVELRRLYFLVQSLVVLIPIIFSIIGTVLAISHVSRSRRSVSQRLDDRDGAVLGQQDCQQFCMEKISFRPRKFAQDRTLHYPADDVTGLLNSELRMRYCVDVLRGGAEVDRDVYQIKRRLSSSGCVNI